MTRLTRSRHYISSTDRHPDSNVGGKVKLSLQRGGTDFEVELDVGDLHAITPDRFVSVAGASFHNISYQQACRYSIAIQDAGVYVCEARGSFRFGQSEYGWLVETVDNKPTPDLETFIEVMKAIPGRFDTDKAIHCQLF